MPPSGDSPQELPLALGQVVANKYRVDRVIGRGGMGVVFAATDTTLDRRVAMKVLARGAAENADAVERFLREGRAAVKLTSDHVTRVFEVGRDGGVPFMVMEYLDGRDLAAELERRGPLPVADALGYVLQACEAIAEAHALGIVHRDLKPDNLFLAIRPGGRVAVKVLDFGISKVVLDDDRTSLTSTGASLGTPLYMAPEQMRSSRDVDARADVWALGVILYELLTGRPPFLSQSVTELAIVVASDPAQSPRLLRPDLPEGLESVILRCLEKAPGARYPTVDALVKDLEVFASGAIAPRVRVSDGGPSGPPSAEELAETQFAAGSGTNPAARVRTDVSWGTTGRAGAELRRRSRRTKLVVASLLVASALAAGGFAVLRLRPPGSVSTRASPAASPASLATVETTVVVASPVPDTPSIPPTPSILDASHLPPSATGTASRPAVRAISPGRATPSTRPSAAGPVASTMAIDPSSVR
jgi:serine/threonine protein kinase